MTEPKINPKTSTLLQAAFDQLPEVGPRWTAPQCEEWCDIFAQLVRMVYPGRKPRVRRAKAQEAR
mgnify:FL=1